jgi:hypothetical protein
MTSDSSDGTKNLGNQNALLHGLYARDVLLPWDSKEDFLRLHEDLKAGFFPDGRAEEEAVLDLAFLHWQKRTIWRLRQSAVLRDPFTEDIIQTKSKSWSDIRKRLRAAAYSEGTVRDAIDNSMTSMLAEAQSASEKIVTTSDVEEIKVLEARSSAFLTIASEKLMALVKSMDQRPDAVQALDRARARSPAGGLGILRDHAGATAGSVRDTRISCIRVNYTLNRAKYRNKTSRLTFASSAPNYFPP